MAGVLCSGNLVADVLVRPVDRMCNGAAVLVESVEQHLGGNAANTAYTLSKLGVLARVIGKVGQDASGEFVLAQLQSAGVDTSFVGRSAAATCSTVVLVASSGARSFLHCLGSSAEVSIDPASFPVPYAEGITHYHLGSPFGLPLLRPHQPELLRRARAAGLTTSLDLHWDPRGRWMEDLGPCLEHVDVLFANQDEARSLTGSTDVALASATLRERGVRIVVVKLGADGCAVLSGHSEFRAAALEVPVVDTTGAGDCFAGGFLCAFVQGASLQEAAELANRVAAASVQNLGAVEGLRDPLNPPQRSLPGREIPS